MKKWNKLTIFLIPIGIAVNVVGGQLALMLKLPVFLDSIGTFVVAALCGIVPGLIVAVGTQLINAITTPTVLAFLLGGFAGTGASTIVAALMAAGWGVFPATFVSEIASETMDKVVCMIIIFIVLKAIPDRLKVKLPNARFFIKDVEE